MSDSDSNSTSSEDIELIETHIDIADTELIETHKDIDTLLRLAAVCLTNLLDYISGEKTKGIRGPEMDHRPVYKSL